jgi:hypothetical protein
MIDNQLAATLEQISQRLFPVRRFEDVLLFNLYHREFAPRRAQRVALPGKFLFAVQ